LIKTSSRVSFIEIQFETDVMMSILEHEYRELFQ
jgi:hypothetical protein